MNAFQGYAEAEATAALRALVAQAAKPALAELEALRVALDVRCESLTATLAGTGNIDLAPLHELIERLVHAAAAETAAAARAARTLALEEAEARLTLERGEAQKVLELARAEAASQQGALAEAVAQAKAQADAARADFDAQTEAARVAREHAEAMRADRDAQAEAVRVANEQAGALRADRDAQVEAATAARDQAEAMRVDRDAHLDAARAVREQAEAMRADRDAHLEAARVAREQAEAMRADCDAHLEAARAAREQAEVLRVERDAHLEAGRAAREQSEVIRVERDAHVEAARVAREQAEAIRADRDAKLEAARAQQTQLLAETHAQLEAACVESERLMAERMSEIAALRAEIEQARADLLRARAATVRVEQPEKQPTIARVEVAAVTTPAPEPVRPVVAAAPPERVAAVEPVQPVAAVAPVQPVEPPAPAAPVATAAPSQPVVKLAPAEPVSQPEPVQVQPPAPPVVEAAVVDPFREVCRSVDEATNLTQILDGLIDGVGAVFPRAALFVVKAKSKRLQGWRSVGFTGVAAITREFEFSLATDSALSRAVNAERMVFTGDVSRDGQPAERPGEPWTVTFPVMTGGRVVAVVHADGGGRSGDQAPTFDREGALEISHQLVSHAGLRMTALTTSARAAFGNVVSADAPAASETPAPANAVAAPASGPDAGLYASQLVSEINRYKQPALTAEPSVQSLQERLAGEIEGSSNLLAGQAPSGAATGLGLFDEALGKMLGNGDRDGRGPSESAAAIPPLFVVQT